MKKQNNHKKNTHKKETHRKEIKKKGPRFQILNSRERKQFIKRIAEEYQCDEEKVKNILFNYQIIEQEDYYYLNTIKIKEEEINLHEMPIYQFGLYIGKIYKKKLILTIEGLEKIEVFSELERIDLNKEEMKTYLNGQDIKLSSVKDGHYIIITSTKQNQGKPYILGSAHVIDGMLLNKVEKNRLIQNS